MSDSLHDVFNSLLKGQITYNGNSYSLYHVGDDYIKFGIGDSHSDHSFLVPFNGISTIEFNRPRREEPVIITIHTKLATP